MKTELEKAKQWFSDKGIDSHISDDLLFLHVNDYEILVSSSEVSYRAELYDDENN